jgi:hypothetical protein
VSTLLYGSETWTLCSRQEKKLNSFHMRCLRRILGISWSDYITNKVVLERADTTSMYTLLKQKRLRWLGHVSRMQEGRIPKDLFYGELATGKRPTGRPYKRYKDVFKKDLKDTAIETVNWEQLAADRYTWRSVVKKGLKNFECNTIQLAEQKRLRTRAQRQAEQTPSSYKCEQCDKDCHSRIGLCSHMRSCRVHLQRHNLIVPQD